MLIAKISFYHSRGRIRQINEYYPYGLTWSRPEDSNMRAYQSKSYQQNEWTTSGMELYDFHARMYDPVIGRWHAPDPMNQFDSPYTAMADNPVVSIDPDGMWVPTGGILNSIGFMGRLTIVRKMTETTARDLTFEEVLGLKDNGVSSALQFIGAALAFNEGSQILSDGQYQLGKSCSNNENCLQISKWNFNYSRLDRQDVLSSTTVIYNDDFEYADLSSLESDLSDYINSNSLGSLFQKFRPDEPSSFTELSAFVNETNDNLDFYASIFRNHVKGDFIMPDGNKAHFGLGNSQVGIGLGLENSLYRSRYLQFSANWFIGGGPQITKWNGNQSGAFDGWGIVSYAGLNIYGPPNPIFSFGLTVNRFYHFAHMGEFVVSNGTGGYSSYGAQYFMNKSLMLSVKLSYKIQH